MKKSSCNIGGQAVMEGVMMRGERSMATAVRDSDGRIVLESQRLPKNNPWYKKVPILRGVVNFLSMLIFGTKILMRSAEVFDEDVSTTQSKSSSFQIAVWIGALLGVGLAVFLFVWLPEFLRTILCDLTGLSPVSIGSNLIAGLIRMIIFVIYVSLIGISKDIRRVLMYHGAEHKTISCYEQGLELTVQNAKVCTRLHDRCGTTFLFLVMMVSVILFSVFTIENMWLRFLVRLLLLPIVSGVSYELLKLMARYDNWLVKIIKAPGLLLQRLTTREPDDAMIEVAISAFNEVLLLDSDETRSLRNFDNQKSYVILRKSMLDIMQGVEDKETDADWILCHVLAVPRGQLSTIKSVTLSQYALALDYAKKRATGKPLQYVLGDTEFYGAKIKVDERVLIPRFDTELLAEQVVEHAREESTVLDMCTGSGAIAISTKLHVKGAKVVAVDVSTDALDLARQNATLNEVEIEFVNSNLFEQVSGKFDIIVSNPPYIPTSDIDGLSTEVKCEPRLALDGGVDGYDYYRRIAVDSLDYLKDNGVLLLEVGIGQAQEVANMLHANFEVDIIKDYNGIDRIVRGKKCSKI
ncbi:MAG: peptide chain release factor N(5)-glutamine methyltransferase [Clostridia bacterium]|nr:peptide chain release factor N(5)-glutamine methyltransferase [Clostridia bacterium]